MVCRSGNVIGRYIKAGSDILNSSDQKPDLLSGAHSGGGGKRILASLEHGPAPEVAPDLGARRRLNSWTAGVLALLLLMSVLAWQSHRRATAPAQAPAPLAPSPALAGTPAAPPVPAGAVAPAPATEEIEPEIISAATIYNEVPSTTPVTTARPAIGPAPAPVLATNQPGKQAPGMASIMARPQAMASAEQRERSAAPRSAARHSATPPARSAQHTLAPLPLPASGARPAQASSGDSDVALLTALVAHAYAPTTVTPERSRDVVVRKEDDSTATLLQRCKQLGLIEGMLCRSRICSDRWDADAACRAPPR